MPSTSTTNCGSFRLRAVIGMLVVGACCAAVALPAEPPPEKTPEQQADDEARQAIVDIAKEYRLFAGPDRIPLVMQEEPVIRWPNPTREVRDGATFVWTRDSRPQAITCVWKQNGFHWFAFQSLSEGPIIAEHGGAAFWRPEKSDMMFQELTDAPEPGDTTARRLIQMKDLARRFNCRLIRLNATKEELRLLPKPLYRYAPTDDKLLDGAMFAFVQGTDPEVIVSIEARRIDEKVSWHYAVTRRCALGLEADLDDKPVWSAPYSLGSSSEPWFHSNVSP
jgi:hypothetical protein